MFNYNEVIYFKILKYEYYPMNLLGLLKIKILKQVMDICYYVMHLKVGDNLS